MMAKKFFPRSSGSSSSNGSSSSFPFPRRKKKSSDDDASAGDRRATARRDAPSAAAAPIRAEASAAGDPAPPSPPRLTRRAVSPSDLHYFTNASGGCNAPLVPLRHHYSSNETLLRLFHSPNVSLSDNHAYVVGLKYIEVALFTIPSHGYYESEEYREQRVRSVLEARRIIGLLEELVREEKSREDAAAAAGEELEDKKETIQKLSLVAQQSYKVVMEEEKSNWDNVEATCTSWKDYVSTGTDNLCSFLRVLDCGLLGKLVDPCDEETVLICNCGKAVDQVDDAFAKEMEMDAHVKSPVRLENETTRDDANQVVVDTNLAARSTPCLSQADIKSSNSSASREVPSNDSKLHVQNSYSNNSPDLQVVGTSESIITEKIGPDLTPTDTPLPEREPVPAVEMQHTTPQNLAGGQPPHQQQTIRQDSDPFFTSDGFGRDELALALSLSKQECANTIPTQPNIKPTPTTHGSNISTQTKLYERQFHSLLEKEKFHVRFLDTYQGRIRGSTNGCTVIAPLTCIQYFTSESNRHPSREWNEGIPDDRIHQVIDVHAPSVLSCVRSKLNLAPDSFIVPSDVHDHLLEVGLLSPASFVGVCGGNILNDEHLMELKHSLLVTRDERERARLKGRKIASALFFHGHVVALHVIHNAGGERVWIELIDSLPLPEAWVSPQRVAASTHATVCEEREPTSDDTGYLVNDYDTGNEWERYEQFEYKSEDELPMNAVRIRCMDVEHFDTLIRHYALSKFSSEERKFIDENEWEDNNSYFDPRVFQAFIWSEAE